jgi:hypothetical protein
MVSNLVDAEPEEVAVGMPVEVAWEDMGPELAVPRFRPSVTAANAVASATRAVAQNAARPGGRL